ncbi:MAG TPA: radical SAM protein, partial [Mycobacterium sp.]|nr:radical SAM protein [Mycobacterium sp.]
MDTLRWPLADAPAAQARLFDEPIFEREPGRGEFRGIEFLHVRARSIINRVPGPPRYGFAYSINAYRGCSHACTYCFARPTHAYLDLGIDEDFQTKIVVKVNAVERVRAELDPRRWGGDLIAMGTNTDPYQRCEGKYRLTQGIVEALTERANPFSIL